MGLDYYTTKYCSRPWLCCTMIHCSCSIVVGSLDASKIDTYVFIPGGTHRISCVGALRNCGQQVRLRPNMALLTPVITHPGVSRTSYNSTTNDFHKLYTDCDKGELICIIIMEMKGTPLCVLLLNNGSSNSIQWLPERYCVCLYVCTCVNLFRLIKRCQDIQTWWR